MEHNRKQYDKDLAAAEDRYWLRNAQFMKQRMGVPRFSINGVRRRHEARQAGTARKPLELDSDQEGRMLQRLDRRRLRDEQQYEAEREQVRCANELIKQNELRSLEAEQKEAKKAEREAVRQQKHAEACIKKEQKEAEAISKREQKQIERAAKQCKAAEKISSKLETKRQQELAKQAKKDARKRILEHRKRRKALEAVARKTAILTDQQARLEAIANSEAHADLLREAVDPSLEAAGDVEQSSVSLPDVVSTSHGKTDPSRAKTARSKSSKQKRMAEQKIVDDEGYPVASTNRSVAEGEEVKPHEAILDDDGESTGEFANSPAYIYRETLTIDQLRSLANERHIMTTGDKKNILRLFVNADNAHTKKKLGNILKGRGLSQWGTKTEVITRLAKDDAGLLGKHGSDFHEKLVAKTNEKIKANEARTGEKKRAHAEASDGSIPQTPKQKGAKPQIDGADDSSDSSSYFVLRQEIAKARFDGALSGCNSSSCTGLEHTFGTLQLNVAADAYASSHYNGLEHHFAKSQFDDAANESNALNHHRPARKPAKAQVDGADDDPECSSHYESDRALASAGPDGDAGKFEHPLDDETEQKAVNAQWDSVNETPDDASKDQSQTGGAAEDPADSENGGSEEDDVDALSDQAPQRLFDQLDPLSLQRVFDLTLPAGDSYPRYTYVTQPMDETEGTDKFDYMDECEFVGDIDNPHFLDELEHFSVSTWSSGWHFKCRGIAGHALPNAVDSRRNDAVLRWSFGVPQVGPVDEHHVIGDDFANYAKIVPYYSSKKPWDLLLYPDEREGDDNLRALTKLRVPKKGAT